MFEYHQTLITMKMFSSLSFGELFTSWKEVHLLFVVAKVIRQYFFSLYLISYIVVCLLACLFGFLSHSKIFHV